MKQWYELGGMLVSNRFTKKDYEKIVGIRKELFKEG